MKKSTAEKIIHSLWAILQERNDTRHLLPPDTLVQCLDLVSLLDPETDGLSEQHNTHGQNMTIQADNVTINFHTPAVKNPLKDWLNGGGMKK